MPKKPDVKITPETQKTKMEHDALYKKPVKEWEETINYSDGKKKVRLFREYPNGVIKSSLKAMFKTIRGKVVQIG